MEVHLPKKPPAPKNIVEGLKSLQRQFRKEALSVQYNKNQNFILLSATIPIKYLSAVTKVLRSLISTSIKEGDCSDTWKFVAHHCENGIFHIKVIDID